MYDSSVSSLDPLALSSTHAPTASTSNAKRPSISPRKPLATSSGNARIQEFYVTTPPAKLRTSSPTKRSVDDQTIESPWRIKLTVEAERLEDDTTDAPAANVRERTTTTFIPLKGGEDESIVAKRGRGRPRKSLDAPSKRKGTPKPKGAARRQTAPGFEGIQSDDIWAPTPSQRSGKAEPEMETASPAPSPSRSTPTRTVKARPFSRSRSRNRRKEITPKKPGRSMVDESEASLAETPSQLTETRRVSKKSSWSSNSKERSDAEVDHSLSQLPCKGNETHSSALDRSTQDVEDENMWRQMIRKDTVSPDPEGEPTQTKDASPDPTEQHYEYDTILESEGFSMVSVESLSSAESRQAISSPQTAPAIPHDHTAISDASHSQSLREESRQSHDEFPENASLQDSCKKSNESSDKEPLSTHNVQTPISGKLTPTQPGAPQQSLTLASGRILDEPSNGTPQFDRVVRAGTVLQSVPSPDQQVLEKGEQSLASPFHGGNRSLGQSPTAERSATKVKNASSPADEPSSIFGGFSAATRRELKAGLRLGEELSKREHASISIINEAQSPHYSSTSTSKNSSPRTPERRNDLYPDLSNAQLPSPARSDFSDGQDPMSWRAEVNPYLVDSKLEGQLTVEAHTDTKPSEHHTDYTMLAREAEWQREREAVIKQIQDANKSQVIVIDSDDDEPHGSSTEDVSSATESSTPKVNLNTLEETSNTSMPRLETPKLEQARRRRSKLPSPWTREPSETSRADSERNESDVFWQPNSAQREIARRRQERRDQRENSETLSEQSLINSNIGVRRVVKSARNVSEDISRPPLQSDEGTTSQHSDVDDLSLQTTHLSLTDGSTISQTPHHHASFVPLPESPTKVPIDPDLLSGEDETEIKCERVSTNVVENPPLPPSWFSAITAPLKYMFTPKPALPPATVDEVLASSIPEPLSMVLPMDETHYRALEPLCDVSTFYTPRLLPHNPRSNSAALLGQTVTTHDGWARTITEADCGIIDAFVLVLRERKIKPEHDRDYYSTQRVTCVDVMLAIARIWSQQVMRGEIKLKAFKGAKAGLRKQGDRIWCEADIDPKASSRAYYEEKRQQIVENGMPSWREMGLKGPFDLSCVRGPRKDDRFHGVPGAGSVTGSVVIGLKFW